MGSMYVVGVIALLAIIIIARTAVVVPQQSAYVVENLGRYSRTIQAGSHILSPFVERIAYKHNLKEEAMDILEQVCITRDNVQVHVDGVLYLKVMDPQRASYGVSNYLFAIIQLSQTALRGSHCPRVRAGKCHDRKILTTPSTPERGRIIWRAGTR